MTVTIGVVETATGSMYRILAMGDHYAAERDGMIVGTVERIGDQWAWVPLGRDPKYMPLHNALAEARKYLEE